MTNASVRTSIRSAAVYRQNRYKVSAVLLSAVFVVGSVTAQTTWVGNTSNDLSLAANWSNGLPVTTSGNLGATFTNAGTSGTTLILSSDLQFGSGTSPATNAVLFNGAGFTIGGSGTNPTSRQLTIGGQGLAIDTTSTITLDVPRIRRNATNTFEFLGSNGNLVVNGEFSTNVTASANTVTRVDFTGTAGNNNTITFNGNIVKVFPGTTAGSGVGNLTISSVGTGNRVVFNNATNTGFAGDVSVGNNAQLQLGAGGGNGTLSGVSSITLGNSASRLIINQSDTVTQGTEFASSVTGLGVVVQQGSGTTVLNAANGFSGGVQVTGGTLLVENTTGSGTGAGAVSVSSGAALGGDGSISGAVTFSAGAKFVFNPVKTLDVAGLTTLPTVFGVDDLVGLDSSVALGSYTLIGGSGSISYTTIENLGLANAFNLGAGVEAYFDLAGDNLSVVVASVIPEASSFAVFAGLCAVGFVGLRRRRSS